MSPKKNIMKRSLKTQKKKTNFIKNRKGEVMESL